MPWNDEVFRLAVEAGAESVGKSRSAVLKEAGISDATFAHPPENARRLDIFERLMPVLGWKPADVLRIISDACGFPRQASGAGVQNRCGEVHIILRNVDVRVTATNQDFEEEAANKLG